ncbi:MAG: VCBS repeat-containing protein [Lentisphaeria bacterium]|nr:VCBS repeat-containing protein [Lentisphaeria bacterium]
MSENITDYACGTFNGRGIAGYHRVKYGETQEYLESLAEAGYILMYSEDNPKEEGKLTVAKPNAMPEYLKDYATNVVYDEYGNFISCSVEGLITLAEDGTVAQTTAGLIAGMKSYLEEIAPKMSDIDSLTDEEVASFNETLKSFKDALRQAGVATYLADTTLDPRTDTGMNPETFDPRTDTSLNDLLDSYIAALDEKEAKTEDTTDPNNWADGPGNVTVHIKPEYAKLLEEYKNVKARAAGYGRGQALFRFIYDSDDAETPSGYELVRTESWSGPDCTDEQIADIARYIINNDISDEQQKALMLEAVDAFLANPKMAQSVFDLTFISTKDAETEAVTSVQVACAEDDGWRTIGTLNNPDGIDWKYQAGNLTGSGAASVVWHAQELGALGVWTDGTDKWTGIAGWFDANWTMLGCGDFDGDGKDSVLMSLSGGQFYSVELDGTLTSLGGLNWSGWEFGAVGDFAGDGKDDIVLFNKGLNCVVLLADGNADAWTSLGTIDSSDWAIAGAGDFNSDGIDDLLVRQASTGLIGGYAGADMSQWSVVDSDAGYYLA